MIFRDPSANFARLEKGKECRKKKGIMSQKTRSLGCRDHHSRWHHLALPGVVNDDLSIEEPIDGDGNIRIVRNAATQKGGGGQDHGRVNRGLINSRSRTHPNIYQNMLIRVTKC